MSLHSELPTLPVELHSCPNARDYFGGSCRCALNTTVISSDHPCDYILDAARSKARDREIETNFDGVTFAEHFGGVSLSSVPRDQHSVLFHHRRLHHQGRSRWEFGNESRSNGAGQESPIDPVASFECSAMLDSEPSASPASSVSPGSLPPPLHHANSPLVTHHTTTPNYEIIASNHQHHQQQQQELSGMNTQHQVTNTLHNNNHHQLHHHSHLQRGPKRRAVDNVPLDGGVPGNRKERRRTQSINTAFAELRECIPNVPADTKLSKIKTLRLATSYIAYLTDMVSRDDNMNGDMETTTLSGLMVEGIGDVATMPMIRQDFSLTCRSIIKDTIKHETTARNDCEVKRKRNRTGWPEHVWALELQH